MLQFLRSSVGSWVVKILFVLLILSFGVWGIGDLFRGRVSNDVAEVGDAKITASELDQVVRREMSRLRQILGDIDMEQARQLGLIDRALDQLIVGALYTQETADKGLIVPDEAVLGRLREEPAFRNAEGQFDPDRFRRLLAANNLSEGAYLNLLKGEMARETLLGAVTSGATAPSVLAEGLYRRQAERRALETLSIPASAMPDPGTPDEATLAAYHEEHAVQFTAPEYRALTVASLTADEIARELGIPEEELRAAYEERIDTLRTPETRDIEQVLVADQETARKVAEAARENGDLAKAAEEAGAEALPLPGMTRDDLLPELADPAFSLAAGEVSEPLQSPLGWHVLRVEAVTPASEPTFEEARGELEEELKREQAADRIYEIANQLDDVLAGGATVPEAAESLGLRLIRVPGVDASGKAPDGSPVTEVPGLDRLLDQAFRLESGESTTLVETDQGGYVVAQVDGITPPALRPLDAVRDQVVAAWQAEQRAEALAKRAEELAERAKSGESLESLASEVPGAEFKRTEPVGRDGRDAGNLPPPLIQQAFDAKPGEVVTAPGDNGRVIARVVEVQVPDPAANEAEVARLRQALEQSLSGDLLAQFTAALRREHEVEINQTTIDTLYSRN